MNLLTQAGVLAEDKLFATLDPTARALKLPGGKTVMLIDTVGLVRRLPHHLVEAFKSTLEQAATADIILNAVSYTHLPAFGFTTRGKCRRRKGRRRMWICAGKRVRTSSR